MGAEETKAVKDVAKGYATAGPAGAFLAAFPYLTAKFGAGAVGTINKQIAKKTAETMAQLKAMEQREAAQRVVEPLISDQTRITPTEPIVGDYSKYTRGVEKPSKALPSAALLTLLISGAK